MGIFKLAALILVGVHFYTLHKFRTALATIDGDKQTTVDEESVSVAPVSVPITMPSNYMVVQAPTQIV